MSIKVNSRSMLHSGKEQHYPYLGCCIKPETKSMKQWAVSGLCICLILLFPSCHPSDQTDDSGRLPTPNVVLIYADDLGYGDLACYGGTGVATPNIDALARQGTRFTRAYASSATCTPSRYSMLTGRYAFRTPGTGVAPGDASLLIDTSYFTLADVFQQAGYHTGIVGKWHLGLGGPDGPDWNGILRPGPLELGFDYAFLIPATNDRVPCVFVEDHAVVGLDPHDPIRVSYREKVGEQPTGKAHPELLRMHPSHGHDQTIVNGISRIGYMTGGQEALWRDEDIGDTLVSKSVQFIRANHTQPFFLFLSTVDVHVPRTPNERFAGTSGMGPRGDAIAELDWMVGQIRSELERYGILDQTLILFSSDNGPVTDDGYQDQSDELLGDHQPRGGLRGGKYSALEAGTRIPFIASWPGRIPADQTSNALISQVDLVRSLAALVGTTVPEGQATDSEEQLPALLGDSATGRIQLIQEAIQHVLTYVEGDWKYIPPHDGPRMVSWGVANETGFDASPQLYHLSNDPGEQFNVADQYPEQVKEMAAKLEALIAQSPQASH